MNELLDTERVYVEELLCVLEVSLCQGWRGHPGSLLAGSPHTQSMRGGWQLYSDGPKLETTHVSISGTRDKET